MADFDNDGNEDLAFANGKSVGGTATVLRGAGTPPLAGNLLTNGGFAGAGAARLLTEFPPIPGWERTGNITMLRYAVPATLSLPSYRESARIPTGGLSLLSGSNATSASQTVDVSGAAGSIDAGLSSTRLSAYLGGLNIFHDRMAATASFLDGPGAALGSLKIGPVTVGDRRSLSVLLRRDGNAPVPPGTRQIRVTLAATDDDVFPAPAFADNVVDARRAGAARHAPRGGRR